MIQSCMPLHFFQKLSLQLEFLVNGLVLYQFLHTPESNASVLKVLADVSVVQADSSVVQADVSVIQADVLVIQESSEVQAESFVARADISVHMIHHFFVQLGAQKVQEDTKLGPHSRPLQSQKKILLLQLEFASVVVLAVAGLDLLNVLVDA